MPPIRAETDIAASPATVRDVVRCAISTSNALLTSGNQFPDFPKLGEWHDLATVTSATPGKETGHDLVPGDAIVSKVRGMTIKQTFQVGMSQPSFSLGSHILVGKYVTETPLDWALVGSVDW